jgi:hypothetical protein
MEIVIPNFTCGISIVNGLAFITNPKVSGVDFDLSPYVSRQLFLEAGGKTLVGWIKAAGTGETLSSELITGWTNSGSSCETLTVNANGHDIDLLINSSGYGICYTNQFGLSIGSLIKVVTNLTSVSRVVPAPPYVESCNNVGVIGGDFTKYHDNDANSLPDGATTNYFTYNTADYNGLEFISYMNTPWPTEQYSLLIAAKQVTAPSPTGVTIVSAQGGSTYNWTSNDGIDTGAASFTLTILEFSEPSRRWRKCLF